MLIGAMNHPGKELVSEIQWIGQMGFDFIDMTLEPPKAVAQRIDISRVRDALQQYELRIVGHTAYYLPLCSPFESLREAAVQELCACLEAFGALGAKWMNLHPDQMAPFSDREFVARKNRETLSELLPRARDLGVGLMLENLPGSFNTVEQLRDLLEPLPEVGLHLDIGHANLMTTVNTTEELLHAYGRRLRHVHLHDNKGGSADLHLPLGTGTMDIRTHVRSLQTYGYDGTITLEVFASDRHFLSYSRDVLRALWDENLVAAPPTRQPVMQRPG